MKALPWIVQGDLTEENLSSDRATSGELTRLAMKLREDLCNCGEKLGDCQDFVRVMNSAAALILAITEPEQFHLPASSPRKAAQSIPCLGGRRSIPTSLH